MKTVDAKRRMLLASVPAAMLARHDLSAAQGAQAQTPAAMEAQAPPLPAVGSAIAIPPLTLLDGSLFQSQQAQGRVTVIYWWASTCPFCALQSPEMQKLWLAHKAAGLQMLALSVDKSAADAQAYLKRKGYTFPSAWVTPDIHRALPKPRGLPVTVVRGRDGKVLQAERGQLFAEDVEALGRWI